MFGEFLRDFIAAINANHYSVLSTFSGPAVFKYTQDKTSTCKLSPFVSVKSSHNIQKVNLSSIEVAQPC